MKSHEQKFAEAIEALAFRLNRWGVADAQTKAREFILELTHQGWRGVMPELDRPRPVPPASDETRTTALATARAAVHTTTKEVI